MDRCIWANIIHTSVMDAPLIVYASYMPKNFELPSSALITTFANCGFSSFFGFAT